MPFGMRPALSLLRFATEFLIVLQPTVLKLRVCVQTLTDTVTRTLRIAHVPTSGDPGWSPCRNIPWDRPARWQAIGTPPVPVGGLQMKTPALPPTTRKAAVLQTTVPKSVNKSQRRLHAGLRTKIQLEIDFHPLF
jgi:hypothetical protein